MGRGVGHAVILADLAGLPGSEQARSRPDKLVDHLEPHLGPSWCRPMGIAGSAAALRLFTGHGVGWDRSLSASRGADIGADASLVRRLTDLRHDIHEEVCHEGWNEGLGTFTQYFGGHELDASVLLLPLVGFLPADDPRMTSTIATIERELTGAISHTENPRERDES